ncbi:hypothetical protein HY256_01615 [Candidatus Sumerlaeota bacterium]|nr:hypothetical protein [Candidatus Sumerlaeota bacterium]
MKLLIMDFDMPKGMKENVKDVRGWWLGADTIRQNPRAGAMFADLLTHEIAGFKFINLFSRVDLKYYFARKRQALKEAYDYLDDDELDDRMALVPKLDYARELNADIMLSGRIIENYLSENRTFHWWKSIVEVECELTDVLSGEVKWKKKYRLKRRFASQYTPQREIARRAAEDLKREYFRNLANKP